MHKTLVAITLLLSTQVAHAASFTVAMFQATKEQDSTLWYVTGVGQGYLYANSQLTFEGKQPIYCQPINLTLVGLNYAKLIESEIKRPSTAQPYRSEVSIEVVLLSALRATFPCIK